MRRKVALGLVVLLAVAGATVRIPLLVRWHASRLASSDPNARAASRAALLAIGRPAIDAVYPDLVAQEIAEEATVTSALVIVGARSPACVRQRGSVDCGAAALATLAAQHGMRVSLDEAARLAHTTETGTNMYDLKKGIEALGFTTKAAKLSEGADPAAVLVRCPVPFIAHVWVDRGGTEKRDEFSDGHWVVVSRVSAAEVELEDPVLGPRRVAMTKFLESFSGKLLLATPGLLARPRDPNARSYEPLEVLEGEADDRLAAWGPVVCPTALALWRDDAPVELAVLAPASDGQLQVRVAIPLGDADRARLVAAVRARLANR